MKSLRAVAPWLPGSVLALGVVTASVSAILIRYAHGADPLALSFWRCAAGAAVLAPFALPRLRSLRPRDLVVPVWTGLFLALHFATWISSIELTTVAASVLLVSTTPVFVAIAARYLLGERLRRIAWAGILLATCGAAIVGGGGLEGSSLTGNLLAIAGAVFGGGYFLGGQQARATMGILEFAVITYAAAAIFLIPGCLLLGAELSGYPGDTWLVIAALVAGPQLLGHTLINLALSDIDATTVSVAVMAEPVIATALAFVLLSETPGLLVYPGGVAILIGIYLVTATRGTPALIVE
ncbi:MAG TPA: DMT family transporter [Actinomycetota bacterium]|nr:DMT family transporter [Actinomycetota bacterium]